MNIAIICAMDTPIPASRGGATETMMTHLIDVNEEKRNISFIFLVIMILKLQSFHINIK